MSCRRDRRGQRLLPAQPPLACLSVGGGGMGGRGSALAPCVCAFRRWPAGGESRWRAAYVPDDPFVPRQDIDRDRGPPHAAEAAAFSRHAGDINVRRRRTGVVLWSCWHGPANDRTPGSVRSKGAFAVGVCPQSMCNCRGRKQRLLSSAHATRIKATAPRAAAAARFADPDRPRRHGRRLSSGNHRLRKAGSPFDHKGLQRHMQLD